VRGRPVHHREGTRGNETTVNLLGNAISQAPVPNLPLRFAVEDIDIGGVTLRAGEAILGYGAAGRDPLVYGRGAGQFDVTRAAKEHLAFGYGVHHCLGAPLARLEAAIALPAIFERYPDLSLAVDPGELMPLESFVSNGYRALPVWLAP
jgi:2-hydroxy-5-methyl-1-naphthoate 7-hydroxylase